MSRGRFPDALVLICTMVVLAQLATYLLPAGEFDRELSSEELAAASEVTLPADEELRVDGEPMAGTEGRTVTLPAGSTQGVPGRQVVPGSYHRVEAEPLPWHAALTLVPSGLEAAGEIIFFVFMVGGVIAVVRKTGAIDALIGGAIRIFGGRPMLLVAGMMALFALGSATIGMAEEYMPFVPILVAMCIALEMDAMVAMGIIYIGAGIGYGCASINPFTVMIAKEIAGQSPSVGFTLRWALLGVMLVVSVHHVMRYVARLRAAPEKGLVADVDYSDGFEMPKDLELTPARIAIVTAMVAMIAVFVWGIDAHGWYLVELTALFLGLGLFAGAIGKLSPNQMARSFTEGAAEMTGTALLIGFARTIEVVLSDARVIDTVIHGVASLLNKADGLGAVAPVLASWGMLAVQTVCNFLIPSGSGQAYVTMPIMAPLADLTGIGRETAILAYQFGDGLTNMIVPTNALLMGMLLLGRIPYQRWARFIVPLLIKLYLICMVVLATAALMRLQ